MKKKKQQRKDLKKRLSAIIKIYTEQKGKSNRKLLKYFIEQKADEIVAYSEHPVTNAIKKTGNKKIEADNIAVAALQRSHALIDELYSAQNNHLQ